jgi:Zn-dependent M28 family amino/carboxypeptidase
VFASSLVAIALVHTQVAGVERGEYLDALRLITSDSLRGNVSFLASDAMAGRNTPSKELDIAAEYIASRFRQYGLKPQPDGTYFQVIEGKNGRNVIGVLPGSDAKLKDSYVLLSAHYDHIGAREMEGDGIFNGANDNASGTSGVIEIAHALGSLKTRPKRTIVFLAWTGEERGLLGSRAYAKSPIFAIEKTVANLNLEQIGRTDDSEASRVAAVSVTGMDYSSVGKTLSEVGKRTGIDVQKHPQFSDMFFARSDNAALALAGVPAHTICTAFEFPDYHKVGDHWDKLDYTNMEKVVRFVAASVLSLADDPKDPIWDASNPKAQRFREKRKAVGG